MKKIIFFICAIFLSNLSIVLKAEETVVVYAHGLGDDNFKASLVDPLFPHYSLYGNSGPENVDETKVCMGQEGDIKQIIAACEAALKNHNSPKIVAFGVSKGAASWINTLGYLNKSLDPQHKKIISCIKAAVLIAPFADLFESELLTGRLGIFGSLAKKFALPDFFGIGRTITASIAKQFLPAYDAKGMHPITSIKKLPNDLPIFLGHSTQDELIPIKHSRMIYQKLVEKEKSTNNLNNKTYLFEFDGGAHVPSIFDNNAEWHDPMYNFLRDYELMPTLEQSQGSLDLRYLQPSASEVKNKILKKSSIPSLAYGVLFACGLETCKYLKYKLYDIKKAKITSEPVKYQTSFKKSLPCGLAFAVTLELIHKIRTV